MATRYEVRTFGDITKAVLETLKIQSSDVESINRIKRNINLAYLNEVVPASTSWQWLNDTISVSVDPYIDGGTADVQQNVNKVELTQIPGVSVKNRFFSVDGHRELYRIASHTAGSSTIYLDGPYNGATNNTADYKIWTDKVVLPSDCMRFTDVISSNAIKPLEKISLQQFRKHEIAGGASIGSPSYCAEGPAEEPEPYLDITGLPSIVSVASEGLLKTVVFNADASSYVSVGDRLHIEFPNSYTYAGDVIIRSVETTTITYTGRIPLEENTNLVVAGMTIQKVNTQSATPAPTLLVYPAIQPSNQRINLMVDYQKFPSELIADKDEPLIPRESRQVLFFGAMWLSCDRETDMERSIMYKGLFDSAIHKMITRSSSIPKMPTIRVSNSYLRSKARMWGSSRSQLGVDGGFGNGFSVGNAPTATGTPNSVAIFDANGYLLGSSDVDIDLLHFVLDTLPKTIKVVADNATTSVNEFSVTDYKSAHILYTVQRGSSYRAGSLVLNTDGVSTRIADYPTTEIGSTGVDFSMDILSGEFRLLAVTDSQGVSATITYKVELL